MNNLARTVPPRPGDDKSLAVQKGKEKKKKNYAQTMTIARQLIPLCQPVRVRPEKCIVGPTATHNSPFLRQRWPISWITTHLLTPEGWKAELA